ncbi:5820_t:CDS:2, partial [Dentiscutata erythropus]
QAELAKSESYEVFESDNSTYNITWICNHANLTSTNIVHLEAPSFCLMQQASGIFKTVNISDTTNYAGIKMLAIKYSRGRPPNNGRIHRADEDKTSSKKSASKYKHDGMVLKLITYINIAVNCNKSQVPATKRLRGQPLKNAKQK